MKIKLICLWVLFIIPTENANAKEVFRFFSSKEKTFKTMQIIKHAGSNISALCFHGKALKCKAWSALQKKAKDPDKRTIGQVGNPAALYCVAYKAKNVIFLDSKNREYDYCVFADNSAVDAWDLYYKHHR